MNINFAIIGCGHIAERHVKHIEGHPKAGLKGVYDIDETKAVQIAGDSDVRVFKTLESLLSDSNIDVVNICTPNGTHAELAVAAMKAGKNVLVEKPMAISVQSAEQMVRVSKETGKKLFVVKQNRYNPPVVEVKRLLDKGLLGKIGLVAVNCFWNRNAAYYQQSSWRGTKDQDGGTLFTQFSHFIDILLYLFGEVKKVSGFMMNTCHQKLIEFEDSGSFTFTFENEALGTLTYSTCAYRKNMEGSISIFGSKGTVKIGGKYLNTLDYFEVEGREKSDVPQSSPANNYGFYEGSMSNHDKVINNVVEALNGREEIMTTGEEGLKVVKTIEQFYSSGKLIK